MNINCFDLNAPSGFFPTSFEVFAQTLDESNVTYSCDMGGGVTIHHGTRDGAAIWLMDNPMGKLYGVWVEENERLRH